MRRRGEWPPVVPAVVLSEALTGDHRRDFHQNCLLSLCRVEPVSEQLAREAAVLRTAASAGGRRAPSAVDAIVVAQADRLGGSTVLTNDIPDLTALARHAVNPVSVAPG